MWEIKILVELRGQPDPAGLNAPVLKVVFLMIGFAGRFKPQPYIVQQGRLFFLRREVAARTRPGIRQTPAVYAAHPP